MICISILEESVEECLRLLEGVECAEIRMEKLSCGPEGVAKIFSSHPRLIATFRHGAQGEDRKTDFLIRAVEAGAAYVDVEVEWEGPGKDEVIRRARAAGCSVIVSYHNHETTPGKEDLVAVIDRCFLQGADLAKVACFVRADRENARLLGLLDDRRPLIVIGMGPRGRITRVLSPLLGSRLSYAAVSAGKETAEGQTDAATLERLLREFADA